MRKSFILLAVLAAVAVPIALFAQAPMPHMKTVEPDTAKAGDVLTVVGENLDKGNVADVFLTDGKADFKTQITEQAATTVKVKVPPSIKPGRLALMILTRGKEPKLIEQPVKVTIE